MGYDHAECDGNDEWKVQDQVKRINGFV